MFSLVKGWFLKDFSTEGYQLWMIRENTCVKQSEKLMDNDVCENGNVPLTHITSNLIQLDFVKSAMTINPCMVSFQILYLI